MATKTPQIDALGRDSKVDDPTFERKVPFLLLNYSLSSFS